MKLATLAEGGGRDGTLIVADRALKRAVRAAKIAPTLIGALEHWASVAPRLEALSKRLNDGSLPDSFALEPARLAAPLPRTYTLLDGSAYLNHLELARRARGENLPDTLAHDPLMYQGCADGLLGACQPILAAAQDWGIDFEAEIAVITDTVPIGARPEQTAGAIRLLLLMNDISARRLIPAELAKGFGFVQGKPPSSFSPVAVTPDELGPAWDDARLSGRLISRLNGKLIGDPDPGVEMTFSFADLIAHGARTRPLGPGTIIGSGTVSNTDRARGSSCLLERRMIEKIDQGKAVTEFMRFGDRIRISFETRAGDTPFGAIDQELRRYEQG